MLFDTHAHLNDKRFSDDLDGVISNASKSGVSKILIASFDMLSSAEALEISKSNNNFYCSIGIHPHDASSFEDSMLENFRLMIDNNRNKVVAIGEIGLDYHYDLSPREIQREVFQKQISFAIECKLPFIVHDREAHGDCLEVIGSFAKKGLLPENPGIFHCYSGSFEMAETLLKYGFYLSFAGPVTFKNAHKTLDFLDRIPLNRILIETDCPYLSPEPFRGKRNEPANVRFVAEKIANICNKTNKEIEDITFENACRIFKIS